MLGLKFKGKHSYKDFGLSMKSIDRTMLPAVKKQEINLPFLHGVIDLQKKPIYENRKIKVRLFKRVNSLAESQELRRLFATWLTGKGELVFDDEPHLTYNAKSVDSIAYEPENKVIRFEISFDCEPLAYEKVKKVTTKLIEYNGDTAIVENNGNVETMPLLTLTNVGTTTIHNINLTLARLKD